MGGRRELGSSPVGLFLPADASCNPSVSVFPVSQEASVGSEFAVQRKWPHLVGVIPVVRVFWKDGASFSLGCSKIHSAHASPLK